MKNELSSIFNSINTYSNSRDNMISRFKNRGLKIIVVTLMSVIMLGLAFVLLYPLLYMFSMAFRPSGEILDPTVVWVPKSLTFANLIQVAKVLDLKNSLTSTILVGVVSSLIQVVTCSIIGYGFARFNFKLRNFLFVIVLLQIILPPQTLIIPQYIEFKYFDFFLIGKIPQLLFGKPLQANLLDTPFAFYLPALFGQGIRSGLLIYIFRQFFRGLPNELEDAAFVDGCGPIRTFVQVMLPNASAAFLTVFLFSVVWYWNDYYYTGMFMASLRTLSVRLSTLGSDMAGLVGSQYDPYKMICQMQAGSLIVIAPPLLLYIIFQRYFVESIERTGIVG